MAAGQLGGQLHPTHDIKINSANPIMVSVSQYPTSTPQFINSGGIETSNPNNAFNLSFGHAIQEWNKHNYKEAVKMFRQHVKDYQDSPWASEAKLHVGCDAQYNGRYSEAEGLFNEIISDNKGKNHYGAKMLLNKARQRLGVLRVLQGNFNEATNLFSNLKKESPDWRHRTYASHWIQRISRYKSDELALLNCGTEALAQVLKMDGRDTESRELMESMPDSLKGHSIKELKSIAEKYGYKVEGLKLSIADLQSVPLPAIVQINAKNKGDKGHYWVLEKIINNELTLFDSQSGSRFHQSPAEFSKEWNGNAIVISTNIILPGVPLTEKEMEQAYGSCCGVPRPEESLGNPGEYAGGPQNDQCAEGSPIWRVNMINLNLFLTDTPMWYTPAIGPPVRIQLSYNSQSSIAQYEPFGNKWTFNYGSYLVVDTGGNVTIFMPDGRRDVYTPDGQDGYTRPFGVFNTLTKIAENHFELAFLDGTVYVYNIPSGNQPFLVEIRDAYNQKMTFGYNSNVQIETITDALNRVTTLVDSDSDGLIDQINDPFGRSAYFEYTNGNLTKITDMGGYWTELNYDADVYLTNVKNTRGSWLFYIEPADGINANADNYPPPGDLMWENYRITVTSPLGSQEEYFYYGGIGYGWYVSPRDYIAWESETINNFRIDVPKITYYLQIGPGPYGTIQRVSYTEGGYVEYGYQAESGKRTSTRDSHGHSVIYDFNNKSSILSVTDAKNNLATFEYYPNDIDIQRIKYNLSSTPEDDEMILNAFTYNGNTHDISTITDRLGNVTELTNNSYGQLRTITEAKGSSIESTTELVYDPATHNLSEIKKSGSSVDSFTYDNIGRVKTKTDAAGLALTYDYNDLDQVTKITYPDTRFETFTYSACCPRLIDSLTDRAGLTTNYTYDALKRLTKVQGQQGIIRYEYDANGNLTKLIDADGKETSFEYDLDNRLKKKIFADGKFVSYTYDPAGLITKITNSRGIEINYSGYDANHNLLTIDYSDATPDVTYTYDDYDRLETMTDGTGLYQYGYDDLHRITSMDGPWPNDTVAYQYNELGDLRTLTPQGGQAITYAYDYDAGYPDVDIGRLKAIQLGANTYTYGYTGVNPLIQTLTRPNGSITEYLYIDPLKRMTEITNKTSAEVIINKHVFTYNNLDLIDTETVTTGTALDSFTAGQKTYNYNKLNQLLNSTNPAEAFTYDDDGNMIQGYTPEGYVLNMTYDAENNLSSAQYTDSVSVVHRTEYYYSGDSMLAQEKKYANGVLVSDTRFVKSGFLPVQERDVSNAVTREYTWGLNIGGGIGGLLNLKQGGQNYNYLYDGKGNVSSLIDNNQQVVASYRYDVFGKLLKKGGSLDQPYRFSTKQYDEQTGHYSFGFRFYSPAIGRWLTRDPLGEAGGINLYQMVGNSPVNHIDPLGLEWLTIYAKRPNGNRYNDSSVNGDVGHAFIGLSDNEGNKIIKGFYPDDGSFTGTSSYFTYRNGTVEPDDQHPYDESYSVFITADQYNKAIKYINSNEYSRYNLVTNNCTDFALNLSDAIGARIPYGDYLFSNPQGLADAIFKYKYLKNRGASGSW